jgi:hypothetical protein
MVTADTRTRFSNNMVYRGSQLIFGERSHLQEVLNSVLRAKLSRKRKQAESKVLKKLILARTQELNGITPEWDRKFNEARNPNTPPQVLLRLARSLSQEDYLMARVLTEHRGAPAELLVLFASHPYSSVRENVARHPNTPTHVLQTMAEDSREPLWFLVACNPSTPEDLRERLQSRMQQLTAGQA